MLGDRVEIGSTVAGPVSIHGQAVTAVSRSTPAGLRSYPVRKPPNNPIAPIMWLGRPFGIAAPSDVFEPWKRSDEVWLELAPYAR